MKLRRLLVIVMAWIRRPVNGVLIAGLLLTAISMALNYRYTTYNSDDVIWQNALLHWRPWGGDVFFADKDGSFILQAPIYWLVSLVVAPGRHAMLVSGESLALINFVLVYYAALYFLRLFKVKITYVSLLPILWLSAFGWGLNRLFLGTNTHTISVGLAFVLLMLVSKLCRGEFSITPGWRRMFVYAAIVAALGLSIANDRYFIYFGVVPALALAGLYVYQKRITLWRVAGIVAMIALSGVVSLVVLRVLRRIGLVLLVGVGSPSVVSFSDIGSYVMNALHALVVITNADLFGQPLFGVVALVGLVNLVIAVAVLAGTRYLLKDRVKTQPEILVVAGLLWLPIISLAFSSFNKNALENFRYLVLVPFVMAIVIALLMNMQRPNIRRWFALVLVASITLNLYISAVGGWPAVPSLLMARQNQTWNYQLISALQKTGVSKGYSEYWGGSVNSYLSGGKLNIEPVKCVENITLPYVWFVDKDQYLAPASRSFYVFVATRPLCTQAQVRQQFGAPAKQLIVNENTVWIYNYDLASRMNLVDLQQR